MDGWINIKLKTCCVVYIFMHQCTAEDLRACGCFVGAGQCEGHVKGPLVERSHRVGHCCLFIQINRLNQPVYVGEEKKGL